VRNRWVDISVLLLLIAGGALTRLAFQHLPNFAPVAAISLFAGYYFRSMRVAVVAPLAIMLLTDLVIGMYSLPLMIAVYAMLVLPVAARSLVRRTFRLDAPNLPAALGSFAGLVGSSLAASVAFFLVTNFMCWWDGHGYSPNVAGLVHCYAQALPFFQNTLLGDLFFSLVLFGGYGAWLRWGATGPLKPVPATVRTGTS